MSSIMKLRFAESKITHWARQYVDNANEKSMKNEEEIIGLKCKVQNRGYLTKKELYKVAYWKSTRRPKLVFDNTNEDIQKITTDVFTSDNDSDKLILLTKLKGVGKPISSAILHLLDKDNYPILSKHSLWSCGIEGKQISTYPFWKEYIHFCRDISQRNGVCMRTLDRALWRYSKDYPDDKL